MEREHSDSDRPSPCGHHNPRTAHFCDVCGVTLPAPCPRCHTVNRSGANFCGGCGVDLRAVGTEPLSVSRETGPATPVEAAAVSRPKSVDLLLRLDRGDTPVEDEAGDAARLERALLRSRRRRRSWAWLGPASVVAVGGTLLVAALVRTQLATPSRDQDLRAGLTQTSARGERRPEPHNGGLREDHSPMGALPTPAAERSPAVTPADPRAGGELTFVVPGEPPSYDAHREETFALIHPAAPHYNTLLRIDPFDTTGTRIIGDLATSWTVSPDKRTYVLKLRRGVKFHDGSEMTSRDVRATYEKIINPPPGVKSARKGEYLEIETVQAPERYIVAFKLRWPSPSFIHSLASPWNWIYKADILERDVRWYETNVMGTGPFTFVEHVKGAHWVGRRNPDYWDGDRPLSRRLPGAVHPGRRRSGAGHPLRARADPVPRICTGGAR